MWCGCVLCYGVVYVGIVVVCVWWLVEVGVKVRSTDGDAEKKGEGNDQRKFEKL